MASPGQDDSTDEDEKASIYNARRIMFASKGYGSHSYRDDDERPHTVDRDRSVVSESKRIGYASSGDSYYPTRSDSVFYNKHIDNGSVGVWDSQSGGTIYGRRPHDVCVGDGYTNPEILSAVKKTLHAFVEDIKTNLRLDELTRRHRGHDVICGISSKRDGDDSEDYEVIRHREELLQQALSDQDKSDKSLVKRTHDLARAMRNMSQSDRMEFIDYMVQDVFARAKSEFAARRRTLLKSLARVVDTWKKKIVAKIVEFQNTVASNSVKRLTYDPETLNVMLNEANADIADKEKQIANNAYDQKAIVAWEAHAKDSFGQDDMLLNPRNVQHDIYTANNTGLNIMDSLRNIRSRVTNVEVRDDPEANMLQQQCDTLRTELRKLSAELEEKSKLLYNRINKVSKEKKQKTKAAIKEARVNARNSPGALSCRISTHPTRESHAYKCEDSDVNVKPLDNAVIPTGDRHMFFAKCAEFLTTLYAQQCKALKDTCDTRHRTKDEVKHQVIRCIKKNLKEIRKHRRAHNKVAAQMVRQEKGLSSYIVSPWVSHHDELHRLWEDRSIFLRQTGRLYYPEPIAR